MSYIVKGETIPLNCDKCDNFQFESCPARNIPMTEYLYRHRHPQCPYISIPEKHGRLIDADALPVHVIYEHQDGYEFPIGPKQVVYLEDLMAATTILSEE